MLKKIIFMIIILSLTPVFLSMAEEKPIKIGVLLAQTGDLGAYGKAIQNGAILAAEMINENGGILKRKIELVHRDSQTEPTMAVDAAQKLIDIDQVVTIVGALSSGETIPVATSVAVNKKIPVISPASTSPEITNIKDNDFLFRTVPSDALQCEVLASVAKEQGFKKISIIYVNNSYGEGLAETMKGAFEMIGGKILESVAFNSNQPSYRSEVQKAVKDEPDALLVIAYPENGVRILREAIEFGLANKFLLTDGMKADEIIKNIGGKYLNGTYGTAPAPVESNLSKKFKEAYQKRFGEMPPKPYIDTCFDAVILTALAIAKGGNTDGTTIRDNLRFVANPPGEKVDFLDLKKALKLIAEGKDINYEGVSGSVNFDKNGDITGGSYGVWKIDNDKIVDVRVEVVE
ncbi:MAG: ABC transporter substrate-binding protein [bacterium]|nr:ABC transporter substrate-binding protein [bacterium]